MAGKRFICGSSQCQDASFPPKEIGGARKLPRLGEASISVALEDDAQRELPETALVVVYPVRIVGAQTAFKSENRYGASA